MLTRKAEAAGLVFVRMNPGEDVLACFQQAVREHGIRNGAIVNGAGSLSRFHVHVVKTANMPPGDVFFKGEGAYDILALSGLVLDGRVHAHITFSNTDKAMGGHLEPGTTVLTFCMAVLADTPGVNLADWDRLQAF